ncbi:uncharacterized protein AB675_10259 [Cyphellophora attinorum]|uniref:Uncharacterized protein n=1 Tax=Cyphellophora attinorum TaxID=1664694 RepID=A0A0N1NYM4_9EURO|nr:uncharacterized protein AB675_10259 [Phialophora attinorum]KPI37412.1 hypothetical protein AB675_10259 [Phialophora attinorum]
MTPLQTPTSPSFESSHPATPLSPSFNHPLDSAFSSPAPSPRLQVLTAFPFQPMALRSSPTLGHAPMSAVLKAHRRGESSISTLTFPSPAEAIFQHIPPTPKTPGHQVPFSSLFSPGSPIREDGRQSRMAMRSPIVERILSLPLRVGNTSASTPPSEPRFPNPPNSLASTSSGGLSDDAMSLSSPDSAYTPHPMTPVIQISAPPPPRRAYSSAVSHLSTPLVPLISVTTGLPHPSFPRSLLQYHLLTHAQLDSLARWYHQTCPPTEESWMYPAWIPPFTAHAAAAAAGVNNVGQECARGCEGVTLETKRRRWGRFIGLRGCESPAVEESGEGLMERMEREWERERERMRDEEVMREKGWRGRW